MRTGADLDIFRPTTTDNWFKSSNRVLPYCIDPFTFDGEVIAAVLARFGLTHAGERKMAKMLMKYVNPIILEEAMSEAIVALGDSENEDVCKAATALIKFVVKQCGIDATFGLIGCYLLKGG